MFLTAVIICKNEEIDLPNCLNSCKDYVDHFVVVDTGSSDRTMEIVHGCLKGYSYQLISSEVGMSEGKIVSFADARNNAISFVPAEADYIISLDADDVVVNPEKLQDSLHNDVVWVKMYGQDRQHQFNICRIWRHHLGIHWQGDVHEYLVLPEGSRAFYSNLEIMHRYGDAPGQEDGIERNLRIMKKVIDDGKATSRNYFYYSNQLRESGRYQEAIEHYDKYLSMSSFHDEKVLAYAYRARCARMLKNYDLAITYCFEGLALDTRWNELWLELAFNYYELGDWKKCIAICDIASTIPIPQTNMFIELDKYCSQPQITKDFALRQMS